MNPKVVLVAAQVFFNHMLTFKGDKSTLKECTDRALKVINQVITDPLLTDSEALNALLICECRIIYQNKTAWDFITEKMPVDFKENHQNLKKRIATKEVKERVNDVLRMVYDN